MVAMAGRVIVAIVFYSNLHVYGQPLSFARKFRSIIKFYPLEWASIMSDGESSQEKF